MARSVFKLLFISSIIAAATSKIICEKNTKDVVCKPTQNEDNVLRRGIVSDSNRTTGITLKNCKIVKIQMESFQNLFKLKFLDLSINKLQELRLGVLDGFRELTFLNLSHNDINSLQLGIFDQKPNLEVLDLKGNKLDTVRRGLLDPFKKLRHLDISSNLIEGRNLDPYTFDGAKNLTFLDFSQNDMSEAPKNLLQSFRRLEFLNLDKCSLTHMPELLKDGKIYTLRHLILSTNYIEYLKDSDDMEHFLNLEILDLTGNRIRSITKESLQSRINLRKILLRNNLLMEIPDNLFQHMSELTNIDLSHNKLNIIPVNAFRGTKLKILNLSDNRFSYLQDNFLLELKNSGANVRKFFFNDNPWQCSCLKEIIKEAKIYQVIYNNVKYDGKNPVCVFQKDFVCKRQPDHNNVYVELFYDNLNKNK